MRVAWLIPVRDEVRWLGEAVNSALAECAPSDEVLVVDDGSVEPVARNLPRDPRVRCLRENRKGIAAALEAGRRATTADLLARLDADDVALSGRVAAQRRLFAEDPNVAAVGGGVELIGVDGRAPGEGMRAYAAWINSVADPALEIFVECPLLHPTLILRASALERVGGWRQGDFPEDYELLLRLHAAGFALRRVPECVLRMRDYEARTSRTDPRYRASAFEDLRRAGLRATLLAHPRRIILWCGPRAGKEWMRWLLTQGHSIQRVIDIRESHARLGIPVSPPEALRSLEVDLLLIAVGTRGAREEIRTRLSVLRPDLKEGRDVIFVR
jgi:glycosyltransferase involved in cell wall biosynthesis